MNYWIIPSIRNQRAPLTAQTAIDTCCSHFGILSSSIYERKKPRIIAEARRSIYYILSKVFRYGPTEIASLFVFSDGTKLNHSSVIKGIQKAKGLMEVYPHEKAEMDYLINQVKQNPFSEYLHGKK